MVSYKLLLYGVIGFLRDTFLLFSEMDCLSDCFCNLILGGIKLIYFLNGKSIGTKRGQNICLSVRIISVNLSLMMGNIRLLRYLLFTEFTIYRK